MRTCSKCREELPLARFSKYRNGYQWWCKECFRAYFRDRGQKHRDQVRITQLMRIQSAKDFVESHLRDQSCADCGKSDRFVMEFDHVRGKKVNEVARLMHEGANLAMLADEIAKCEVVCANCHRRRTAARKPNWRTDISILPRRRTGVKRNLLIMRNRMLATGCEDCGVQDLVVLEFDHVGEKSANVSDMASDGVSAERLLAEIDQCEVRCANCHRRKTVVRA